MTYEIQFIQCHRTTTVNKHTIAGISDVTNFLTILFANYNLHTDQIGIQLKSPKLELVPNIK